MNAEELAKSFDMESHVEHGSFKEIHFKYEGDGRAPSGALYYYVPGGEKTLFHRIDCGEYWCYAAGESLELWMISPKGELSVRTLGIEKGAEPVIYVPEGFVFASKQKSPACGDGTFLTCITVPRFSAEGFELFEKDRVTALCPEAGVFWE